MLIHFEYNPILLEIPNIKNRFWDCVVIDGFMNNNNRGDGDWGLLYIDNTYKMAPIYGNGGAFSDKLTDKQIETIYVRKDKKLKEILEIDNVDLKNAIIKNTDLILEKFEEIKEFILLIPEKYNGITVISKERKEYYIKGMEFRFKNIIFPVYNKVANKVML